MAQSQFKLPNFCPETIISVLTWGSHKTLTLFLVGLKLYVRWQGSCLTENYCEKTKPKNSSQCGNCQFIIECFIKTNIMDYDRLDLIPPVMIPATS